MDNHMNDSVLPKIRTELSRPLTRMKLQSYGSVTCQHDSLEKQISNRTIEGKRKHV